MQDAPAPFIIVTNPILENIAQEVSCHKIAITSIIPRNADAHEFMLLPSHRKQIEKASLIIGVGAGYDAWINKVANKGSTILIADELKVSDPHFWQSPKLVKSAATIISTFLKNKLKSSVIPNQCLDNYIIKIEDAKNKVSSILHKNSARKIVIATPHQSLLYFAQEFNFTVLSLSMQASSLVAPKHFINALQNMKHEGVMAVFYESEEEKKQAETLSQNLKVKLGARLYVDTLDLPQLPTGSIVGTWQYNAEKIVESLR